MKYCLKMAWTFKMDLDTKYTFLPLSRKYYNCLDDRKSQELLAKWGLRDNISIQLFSFNEPFHLHSKDHFTQSFFKDPTVVAELKTKSGCEWVNERNVASQVYVEQIPCSVLTMTFYDKLKDPANNITYDSNKIRKCMRYDEAGHEITDNLKAMFIDQECEEYALYDDAEREEFIFFLTRMFVIGGELCQYEDTLEPYMEMTKSLYRDLIRVNKRSENDLYVSTTVLKVVVSNDKGSYFPVQDDEGHNFGFLLIDAAARTVTTFLYQQNQKKMWNIFEKR